MDGKHRCRYTKRASRRLDPPEALADGRCIGANMDTEKATRRARTGASNHMWKGGRVVASNGYVLLRMPGHHLADCRGYVYEHRLVAEKNLGRRLLPGEIPHHINEVKSDNRPENIEVAASHAHHRALHRKPGGKQLRMPDEPNSDVACGCGCGTRIEKYDVSGRLRLFVSGHNPQPAEARDAILDLLSRGSRHRDEIAVATKRSVQVVAVTLSKLRASGVAKPLGGGVWALS